MGSRSATLSPAKLSDKVVRQQLSRILSSKTFSQVERLKRFVQKWIIPALFIAPNSAHHRRGVAPVPTCKRTQRQPVLGMIKIKPHRVWQPFRQLLQRGQIALHHSARLLFLA